jgi:hypothetical protein
MNALKSMLERIILVAAVVIQSSSLRGRVRKDLCRIKKPDTLLDPHEVQTNSH